MVRMRKKKKVHDLDLLPMMNLFSILIPFLLSVAQFQKIALVEVNMPTRSTDPEQNKNIDEQTLNLSVAIMDDGLTIGASGGFYPKFYAREMVEYQCADEKEAFQVNRLAKKENEKIMCKDGTTEATDLNIKTIHMFFVEKTSEEDPGQKVKAVYNDNDSLILDKDGQRVKALADLKDGDMIFTLAEGSGRTLTPAIRAKLIERDLSVYDVLAETLVNLQKMNKDGRVTDLDKIIVYADHQVVFDKVIQVMDVAAGSGFPKISLGQLAAGG